MGGHVGPLGFTLGATRDLQGSTGEHWGLPGLTQCSPMLPSGIHMVAKVTEKAPHFCIMGKTYYLLHFSNLFSSRRAQFEVSPVAVGASLGATGVTLGATGKHLGATGEHQGCPGSSQGHPGSSQGSPNAPQCFPTHTKRGKPRFSFGNIGFHGFRDIHTQRLSVC